MPREEPRRRVGRDAARALRIDSLAGRRPEQLTPQQRLRTALARALVTEPELLVLDEPLGAARSRDPRGILGRSAADSLEAGVTTLVLTDDPARPWPWRDRLAVMDLGRIVQFGPPHELYNRPDDVFVARLLGPTNLLQGQVESQLSDLRGEVVVRTPLGRLIGQMIPGQAQGRPSRSRSGPRRCSLGPTIPSGWNRFPATVERIIFRGELARSMHAGRATGRSPSRRSRASRRTCGKARA